MHSTHGHEKIAALLDDFQSLGGSLLAEFETIPADLLPEPYSQLLAHEDDMTPTLERFHGRTISLDVIKVWHDEQTLLREVLLRLDGTDEAVEIGTIRIHLNRFAEEPRARILACRQPLGSILGEFHIPHHSSPTAFLRLRSNEAINRRLGLGGPVELSGRCNVLANEENFSLAEVIEIIPPLEIKNRSIPND